MPKPGDKIRIMGRLYEYPKLLPRKETLKRLQEAKDKKIMTPDLQVIDPVTKKVIMEAGYGRSNSPKEVIKKITED